MNHSSFTKLGSALLVAGLGLNIGCDRSNPRKMTPPEIIQEMDEKTEIATIKISNAVDILFVVDNSESMSVHQQNLAANIQHFVNVFENNSSIDYHIGIVPVYDSVRYGSSIKTFNPNGQLLPLKGDTGELSKYYYTRDHNNHDLLAQSIHIGVLPLKDKDGNYQGPEFEEALSPIRAAFSEPAISSPNNSGFLRPEARLAVIIITDADDASPDLSGGELDHFLRNIKQDPLGEKISTFGVLANRDECGKDVDYGMAHRPDKILDFLSVSQGEDLSLCKGDFAEMLTSIGQQIERKAQKQTFSLKSVPEVGTLRVSVGGVDLPPGKNTWTYDPTQNMVIVASTPGRHNQDLSVSIRYKKVNMQNIRNGRAKRFDFQPKPQ